MADSDWKFIVGVDTTQADRAIKDFTSRTADALRKIASIKINVDTKGLRDLQAISLQQEKNERTILGLKTQIVDLENRLNRLANDRVRIKAGEVNAEAQLANAEGRRIAANARLLEIQQRIANAKSRQSVQNNEPTFNTSGVNTYTEALNKQRDAWDFLGRVARNTVFKFIEYDLLMRGFTATVNEFRNSLQLAGNVQLEQALQRLYNPVINLNTALSNSITIARAWGADIQDVQQAIGLWTKQTNDLEAATYLANQAEMMHRASGIDSLEVYRSSIAIVQQLGLKLKDLPSIYDEVANASLKIAVPMKNLNGKGGQEAMRDMFEGLQESAATLKAMGFDSAGIIAVVGNQVQAMGENGKEAAKNLTSMFAALEGKGEYRKNFEGIVGSFKNTDDLLTKMQQHSKELFQEYANGGLGVRPQQFETLQTFMASLQRIKKLYEQIRGNNSKGMLALISETEMNTFNGQMERLKTNVQAFTLALGQQMLPAATGMVKWLNAILPAMTHFAGGFIVIGQVVGALGAALLALQAKARIGSFFEQQAMGMAAANRELEATNVWLAKVGAQEFSTSDEVKLATATMEQQKAVLAELAKQYELAQWQVGGFQQALTKAKITEQEFNTVAGVETPTALQAASAGFRAFGMNALAAVGPIVKSFASMYAIMQAIQILTSAMNTESNKENDFKVFLDKQTSQNGVTNAAGQLNPGAWSSTLQMGTSYLFGHGGDAEAAGRDFQNLIKNGGPHGSIASQFQAEWGVFNRARAKGSAGDHARDIAKGNLERLFLAWQTTHSADAQAGNPNAPGLDLGIEGSGALVEPTYNKTKPGKQETVQQQYVESVDKAKRSYMALASAERDEQAAAQTRIDTIHTEIQMFGLSKQGIAALNQAYADRDAALRKQEKATKDEITLLKERIKTGKDLLAHTDPKSQAWHTEAKAVSMAEAALTKAQGALDKYAASRENLRVKAEADLRTDRALAPIGNVTSNVSTPFGPIAPGSHGFQATGNEVGNLTDYLGQLTKGYKNAKGPVAELKAAQQSQNEIMRVGLLIYAQYISLLHLQQQGHAISAKDLQALRQLVLNYGAAWTEAGNSVTSATDKQQGLLDSLQSLSATIDDKFIAAYRTVTGTDGTALAGLKAQADAYKEITGWIAQLQSLQAQYAKTLDPRAGPIIQGIQQEIAAYQQLAPELQRIADIQNSVAYKALNSGLDKWGSTEVGNFAKKMFGKGNSPFATLMQDVTTSVLDDWWKKAAAKITATLTHAKLDEDKQKQYEAILRQHGTDSLNAAKMMLDAAMSMEKTFSGHPGSSPVTSSPTRLRGPFDQDPTDPNNPNVQQLQQQQADVDANHPQNKEQAENTGKTAQATGSMSDYFTKGKFLADFQSGIMPLIMMLGLSATNGASGTRQAAGIAAFIQQTFGANWDTLSTDANGNTILADGAGMAALGNGLTGVQMGAGFGAMFGGGTHTTWGEVGGGIGGVAGTILGLPFGPAGALVGGTIGAAAGSFIGSLFGKSSGNANTMPDQFAQGEYGQDMGNYLGQSGDVNGQSFSEQASVSKQLNGQSESAYLSSWIAANPAQAKTVLTPQQLALFSGNDTITNLHNGVLTLANGQQMQWQQFFQNVTDALNAIKDNTANKPLAPIIVMGAYGAGPGYTPNPYNLPGINSQEYGAIVQNSFSSVPTQATYYGTTPYNTPGVGGSAPGSGPVKSLPGAIYNGGNGTTVVNTTVNLDGRQIAQVVTAYQTQNAINSGSMAA